MKNIWLIKCLFFPLTLFTIAFIMLAALKDYLRPNSVNSVTYNSTRPHTFSEQKITPVKNTKHLMVNAYKDHRIDGAIRIISIIRRDAVDPLFCIVCCAEHGYFVTTAEVDMHSDHFGFPFVTSDLLCRTEQKCNATHVTISSSPYISDITNKPFLPIKNINRQEDNFQYTFTVCISNLFGEYNNVLQFVQTIEVYKLLGIQKVVIYNTSCGPDLEKVLQYYKEEGTLDIEPWPIDRFLNPSKGWNFEEHKGDLHYYGQLTTLNDCIYRNMYRSKYVLLNDIDEIIVPYQHATLGLLLEDLQHQNPTAAVFLIENHIFPKTQFDDNGTYSFDRWKKVPGINILEHIYREPDKKNVYHPYKLIVNPRQVVQTSVHSVLKNYGDTFNVPPDVCRIVHVRVPLQGHLTKEQLFVDTKLWEYDKELLPNIDAVLQRTGLQTSNNFS